MIALTIGPEPQGDNRFTLEQNSGTAANPTYTLTIADCVQTVTTGEFASAVTPSLTSTAGTRLAGRLGSSDQESKVTAIRLPDSLVSIGRSAFFNHKRVSGDFIIPASVESIGIAAFLNLGGASSVNLKFARGSRLRSIGVRAFHSAKIVSMTDIDSMQQLPRSLRTIEAYAFHGAFPSSASFQSNFIIPGNVTKVGNHAFGTGYFTGILTIESPRLTKPNLGNDIFHEDGFISASARLTTIILPSTVFESYSQPELNAIFRPLQAGGKYLDLADKTTELTK